MADESTPSDLASTLLKGWWVIILGLVVGALAGFGVARLIEPTYTATAVQLVKGIPGTGVGANYVAAQFAVARAKSYPALIASSSVLEAVNADLGGNNDLVTLRSELSAENPIDTPLVRVTATGNTPAEAQEKANSAARHLARYITQIETVSGVSPVIVETAVQAGLPAQPSAPQPFLFVAMGGALGFAAGVGLVLLLAWRAETRRVRAEASVQLKGSTKTVGDDDQASGEAHTSSLSSQSPSVDDNSETTDRDERTDGSVASTPSVLSRTDPS